jgi:hypothetical protein
VLLERSSRLGARVSSAAGEGRLRARPPLSPPTPSRPCLPALVCPQVTVSCSSQLGKTDPLLSASRYQPALDRSPTRMEMLAAGAQAPVGPPPAETTAGVRLQTPFFYAEQLVRRPSSS